uniref:Uncharacterized protein n=1 Tax=Megaselia scalaris TaxID=36166 RepID=T1H189_MEGSC
MEAGHIIQSSGKIYSNKVDELHTRVINCNAQLADHVQKV